MTVSEGSRPSPVAEKNSREGSARGKLESINGRIVEGWAFDPSAPEGQVVVNIFADERFLGSVVAGLFRADLYDAGLGDGRHAFSFLLPPDCVDGAEHNVAAQLQASGLHLEDSPRIVHAFSDPHATLIPVDTPIGAVDVITEDGWVQGWAWYPGSPERRVEVEILADNVIVGSAIAAIPRTDLADGGIGDGAYAFSVPLPFEVISNSRESVVIARDRRTGSVLSPPRLYRRRALADALVKVAALEDDVRLLRSSLERFGRQQRTDERAAADLFRTVGDFFVRLAETSDGGKPASSMITLRGAIDRVNSQFEQIEFECRPEPKASICISSGCQIENLYRTLKLVSELDRVFPIEVILIDDGNREETALMPLLARNLRYLAMSPKSNSIAAYNHAATYGRGDILLFLGVNTELNENSLSAVLSAFNADTRVSMLAAKIIRADGVLDHAGIDVSSGEVIILGLGENPELDVFARPRLVDGVAIEAFSVRASAWKRIGGLDESVDSLFFAMKDFCARILDAGDQIIFEPDFRISLVK